MLLILLATAGFVIGVAIEKSSGEGPHTDERVLHEQGGHEERETAEGGTEVPSERESSETALGLDIESTPLVVTGSRSPSSSREPSGFGRDRVRFS
jgi:hypothetical protein